MPSTRSRLGRFLTLSTAGHAVGAALSVWLSLSLLPTRPDESLVVRTIDFVEPPAAAPRAARRAADDGGPPAAAPRRARAAAAPAPARSTSPTAAPAAVPPPAEEPARAPDPPPSPEDVRLAAATPKAVGQSAAATRGPVALSSDAAGQPSAAPRGVATGDGGGPVAPVALPPGLARGAGGSGAGGTVTGVKGAETGGAAGTGNAAGAGAGTGVDTADPDFSEYFRLIERRVRSAWKFPESLGGTTQTVKIGFSLAPDGGLRDARVVSSSSGVLNGSALAAMKQASPFPPLPVKFKALAGQPLVMSFTVTIR